MIGHASAAPVGRGFEALAQGRDNNLNLIRMAAAVAVILSHSYPLLLGVGTPEPLQDVLGYNLGTAAVRVFFALSGFLILMSFERRRSNLDFVVARVFRLIPGLLVMAILTVAVLGPLLTVLPLEQYAIAPETWRHVPDVVSLVRPQSGLAGVFAGNPYQLVNGSLWTLYYEAACYLAVLVLGLAGALDRRRFLHFLCGYAAVCIALRLVLPERSAYELLSLPFVMGMAGYRYRRSIPTGPGAVVAVLLIWALSMWTGALRQGVSTAALSYLALWLGQARSGLALSYNRLGDYSYGAYIYAWPIQQVLVANHWVSTPMALFAWSALGAVSLGYLSWRLVEHPALQLRLKATERIARHLRPPSFAGWAQRTDQRLS